MGALCSRGDDDDVRASRGSSTAGTKGRMSRGSRRRLAANMAYEPPALDSHYDDLVYSDNSPDVRKKRKGRASARNYYGDSCRTVERRLGCDSYGSLERSDTQSRSSSFEIDFDGSRHRAASEVSSAPSAGNPLYETGALYESARQRRKHIDRVNRGETRTISTQNGDRVDLVQQSSSDRPIQLMTDSQVDRLLTLSGQPREPSGSEADQALSRSLATTVYNSFESLASAGNRETKTKSSATPTLSCDLVAEVSGSECGSAGSSAKELAHDRLRTAGFGSFADPPVSSRRASEGHLRIDSSPDIDLQDVTCIRPVKQLTDEEIQRMLNATAAQ